MKSTAWLPVLILLAVALASGFSWYLSDPDRQYLFDGEKGISRPWVADWWTIKIPVAFAVGVIAAGTVIVMLRCARSRAWRDLVASAAVAGLGIAALGWSISYFRQQAPLEPIECEMPTPHSPRDVFDHFQWVAMSLVDDAGTVGGCLRRYEARREGGVGLKNYPGRIPYDPFLLKRISFVGLTSAEVENILGPPLPDEQLRQSAMVYVMTTPDPDYPRAALTLSFADRWERSETVRAEYLRVY